MSFEILSAYCIFTNYCAERKKLLEGKGKMDLRIKFYRCKVCGKVLVIVNDTSVPTVCCGEIMEELEPLTKEEAFEKHMPVIHQDGNIVTVKVGDQPHPMTEDHYIQWIILTTDKGIQKRFLCPNDSPQAEFILNGEESIIGAYAFCNIHRLWKDS